MKMGVQVPLGAPFFCNLFNIFYIYKLPQNFWKKVLDLWKLSGKIKK